MTLKTNAWVQMRLVLQSGRIPVSALSGLASGLYVFQSTPRLDWVVVTVTALALTLTTMVGFIANDIADVDKDRLQGKSRPIATGTLSVRTARTVALMLALLAVAVATLVLGVVQGLCLLTILLLLWGYSPFAKAAPLFKGLYTAALCLTPFAFGATISGLAPPPLLLVGLFVYVLARECVLDAQDLKGDVAVGMKTVPFYIGQMRTIWLGWALMLMALGFGATVSATTETMLLFFGAIMAQLVALRYFSKDDSDTMDASRFAMLGGVFAICLSI